MSKNSPLMRQRSVENTKNIDEIDINNKTNEKRVFIVNLSIFI